MHCVKCGAFVSKNNRIYEGRTNVIVIFCKKCGAVLSIPFVYDC